MMFLKKEVIGESMKEMTLSQSTDIKVRKIMARSHMNANRLEEAVDAYAEILRDYPDDEEVLLVLGNLYLASGDSKTAEKLYRHALELDPENKEIEQQVLLAQSEDTEVQPEPVPTDPEALARLLMRLTGRKVPITEKEMVRAASLLQDILQSTSPAQMVAEHLDDIDNLLPALIEINIRQARADGRGDLAKALQNLQINIAIQLESQKSQAVAQAKSPENLEPVVKPEVPAETQIRFTGRVLVLVPDMYEIPARIAMLVTGLKQLGCKVKISNQFKPEADAVADVMIASNPHLNPQMMENLAAAHAAGVPVILDLDDDFEEMPVTHPEYNQKGLGDPKRGRAYATALLLAKAITVPSRHMGEMLKAAGHRVFYLPEGWSRINRLWSKPSGPRQAVNLGWLGASGQLEDLFEIRRVILRVMREFPETQMVVIGNPQAYRLFDALPANRRMYLPMVGSDEYPYLLGQLDILLAPNRKIPYNNKLSDRVLVEAGVKGLPWIASDIPAYEEWNKGGLIARSPTEWHTYLRQLIMDHEIRVHMGQEGQVKAQTREYQYLAMGWQQIIEKVLVQQTSQSTQTVSIRKTSSLFPMEGVSA